MHTLNPGSSYTLPIFNPITQRMELVAGTIDTLPGRKRAAATILGGWAEVVRVTVTDVGPVALRIPLHPVDDATEAAIVAQAATQRTLARINGFSAAAVAVITARDHPDLASLGCRGATTMPFIIGETLNDVHLERKCMPAEWRGSLRKLLESGVTLHARDLAHEDFKPLNFMLTDDGVEVLDLGGVSGPIDRPLRGPRTVGFWSPDDTAGSADCRAMLITLAMALSATEEPSRLSGNGGGLCDGDPCRYLPYPEVIAQLRQHHSSFLAFAERGWSAPAHQVPDMAAILAYYDATYGTSRTAATLPRMPAMTPAVGQAGSQVSLRRPGNRAQPALAQVLASTPMTQVPLRRGQPAPASIAAATSTGSTVVIRRRSTVGQIHALPAQAQPVQPVRAQTVNLMRRLAGRIRRLGRKAAS